MLQIINALVMMQEALLRFSQRRVAFVGLIKQAPENWKKLYLHRRRFLRPT